MTDINHIQSIEERRQKIAKELVLLQEEDSELEVALRVLQRFSPEARQSESKPKLGPSRPEGAPTTFEMTTMVLASAEKEGRDGLTGSEIVKAIGGRYWPGVTGPQVLPSIYGFAKVGRLHKTASGKFKRIKDKGPEA